MAETGICLIWVPPSGLVEALVRAKGKAVREQVLLGGSAEILDSIERVLADAAQPARADRRGGAGRQWKRGAQG